MNLNVDRSLQGFLFFFFFHQPRIRGKNKLFVYRICVKNPEIFNDQLRDKTLTSSAARREGAIDPPYQDCERDSAFLVPTLTSLCHNPSC